MNNASIIYILGMYVKAKKDDMTIEEEHNTKKLLYTQSLLKLLPSGNWNDKLLSDAEADCGFAPGYSAVLFPGYLSEIIEFFEKQQDQKMLNYLSKLEVPPSKIRDKIAMALKIRIKSCVDKTIHVKNTTYFALSLHITEAATVGFRTCDAIWCYAGDKSSDHNYYTKRGILFSIYVMSIMYYIQDKSENYVDTDSFIDNSLSNVISMFSRCKLPKLSDIPIARLFS